MNSFLGASEACLVRLAQEDMPGHPPDAYLLFTGNQVWSFTLF